MQLIDYMQTILDRKPLKYSILFGEEQKIIDIYIDKLSELGYKKIYKDSIIDVIKDNKKIGLVDKNKLYIVSNDNEFITKENKWDKVINNINTGNNLLVLRYDKLKKSSKFYKKHKDFCIEFLKVEDAVFQSYIMKLLPKLDDKHIYKLQEICNKDYGRLLLESDKIKQLSENLGININKSFEQLLEEDLFVTDIGDITFDLTNSVIYGDLKNSQKCLIQAKQKGEPVLRIASILYQSFTNLLAYQGLGKNKIDAANRIGVTEKQLWAIKKNAGGYSNKELLRNINICQEVESDIKLGKLSEDIALDYLVLNCLY